MDYQLLYVKGNYSDKKRMKGIYRFVKRVYRNVIERNHRRSLLESVRERIACFPNWLMGIEGDVVSCLYEIVFCIFFYYSS